MLECVQICGAACVEDDALSGWQDVVLDRLHLIRREGGACKRGRERGSGDERQERGGGQERGAVGERSRRGACLTWGEEHFHPEPLWVLQRHPLVLKHPKDDVGEVVELGGLIPESREG